MFLVSHLFCSLCIFHRPLYILGYAPAHNRVYLANKGMSIYTYLPSLNVVEYQTAVLRGDMDAAEKSHQHSAN